MFGAKSNKEVEAAKFLFKCAVEAGRVRYAIGAAKQANITVSLSDACILKAAIDARPDISARVEDMIDYVELVALDMQAYLNQVDTIIEEIAGWHNGKHIPRVAKHAQGSALRTELIEKMFALPEGQYQIYPIFEALNAGGLAEDVRRSFGERLVRLAIRCDDAKAATQAAHSFLGRPVTKKEKRDLVVGRMNARCTEEAFAKALEAANLSAA